MSILKKESAQICDEYRLIHFMNYEALKLFVEMFVIICELTENANKTQINIGQRGLTHDYSKSDVQRPLKKVYVNFIYYEKAFDRIKYTECLKS